MFSGCQAGIADRRDGTGTPLAFIPLYDGTPYRYIRRPFVAWALLAANVIIFFVVEHGTWSDADRDSVWSFGIIPALFNHQFLRPHELAQIPEWSVLLTYSFFHADFWHLAGNMVFLWVFADNIEDAMGHVRFLAFYLLVDWDRMVATVDSWLPRDHRDTIRGLLHEMDMAIAGFLRGQALVCVLLGGFYAIGLSIVGVNFGALIGIISGLLSFIPYVGSLTGLVLSVGVATVQFWPDWTWPLATLGVFLAGQFLEGNIFQPKFVGDSIGVHPVWLMFALLAFGSLFGFVGLLLAVPLSAVIGVLCRFALRQYLASNLYRGIHPQPTKVDVTIDIER